MIYLTDPDFIRRQTGIGGNVADSWLLPALREVQELRLRELVGDCLLDRLKQAVEEKSVDIYTDTVIMLQPWLAYSVAAAVAVPITVKTSNIGVHVNADDKVTGIGHDGAVRMESYWRNRADACLVVFEKWILRQDIPELGECGCSRMRAHLESAASCGLWLGGARGYRYTR